MIQHDSLSERIRQIVSADELPNDPAPFLIDQRKRYHSQALVVQPQSVASVQRVVQFCQNQRISLTPQGGNTGLVGGTHAQTGIILNLSKLNRIRDINLVDNTITAEAGCVLQTVQNTAWEHDRFFPLSLASEGSCQIGGNIACNAGGLNVVKYGTMRDQVLGLEIVLPNGELIAHLNPLHKNTTGYELKHLFIGSEGTLGIITAATLKLHPRPQTTETAWIGINTIAQATQLLNIIQNQFGERLSSFELISEFALQLSSHYTRLTAPTQAPWHVLLELSDSLVQPNLADLLAHTLINHHFDNSIIAQSEHERQTFWRLRENISSAQRHLGISIKHDIALPIKDIAPFIKQCEQALLQAYPDIQIVVFGHLGDGSLHYNTFLPNLLDQQLYQHEEAINTIVYEQVLTFNGTIAAEHGIGCLKNHWLNRVRQTPEIALMKAIKAQLDPHHLFNPNKLLP